WFQFLKALAMLAGAVLAADILLITAEVLFRNLGWRGLGWASDVIEYSLPLSTLLVAPWLVAQKGHVKLDLLVERMASPHRDLLFRATMWLAACVTGVLVYASVLLAVDTYNSGALVMKSLVFPEWWVMAAVPPLFLLIAIECLRSALAGAD
ncbi:MAG TPA: TRAP transporter small permease, partial [Burkholderiaceae bacterium]|nr:TRAP transporter small permease [Burkholderiaceae bacterium]